MPELLGVFGLTFVAVFTLLCAQRWPYLSMILFVSFMVRSLASVFNVYIAPLPDSTADALAFERVAWEWSQGGFIQAVQHFNGPDSYLISWIISLLYAATDRSFLLAQSISLLFGMGAIVLGSLLTKKIWGKRAAIKAGWALAFFPTLILYSSLVMREAYIWFFLLIALYGTALWANNGGLRYIMLAMTGFLLAAFFHGAMFVGALFFLMYVGFRSFQRLIFSLSQTRIHIFSCVLTLGVVAAFSGYVASGISLPKLGTFQQAISSERILNQVEGATRGSNGGQGASFPDWTVPKSAAEVPFKAPVRMAYFTFAPFPWDIRAPSHFIGFLDGLLYVILFLLIWSNRRAIRANPAAIAILFVLLGYIIVFAFGVGNFGTGLRHRTKFVVGFIILAAPMLPMFTLKFRQSRCGSLSIHSKN